MAEKKILCPLMGGKCIEDGDLRDGELVACRFWVVVHGKHPQTGEDLHTGDCAFAWTPILMIENSKVNRETGAAIESFRNETINRTDTTNTLMAKLLHAASSIPTQTAPQEKLIIDTTSQLESK